MREDVPPSSSVPPSGLGPGTVIDGRYRVIMKAGGGGMGTILLARHLTLDCDVVIKIMNDETAASSDGATRFEREARAAAQLCAISDHAVAILDFGDHEGVPFIVMELLRGEHLGARLKVAGPLGAAHAVGIARQLTSVLTTAHRLGIVHRDLKPENIFLAQRDGEESVKLLDFGALKHLGPSRVAQPTERIGTLAYMSPEQFRGESIDCRADLWAFAVVLFEMITGAHPFDATDLAGMVYKICFGSAPLASSVAPHLSALDPLFRRAFARDPDRRFQSAEELARAFAEALRLSYPPSSMGVALPVIPPPPVPVSAALVAAAGLEAPPRTGDDDSTPTIRSRV